MPRKFTNRHVLHVVEFVLIGIAAILGPVFFLFGSLEAIINKDQTIFNDLITTAFTLAGFTIAATAFGLSRTEINIKRLIGPTIAFLISGFLMYANLLVVQFIKFNVDITKDEIIRNIYAAISIAGAIGIILFFIAIAYLIREIAAIYFELKEVKSQSQD